MKRSTHEDQGSHMKFALSTAAHVESLPKALLNPEVAR